MSKTTGENLRYLLWREQIPRDKWPQYLADWIECNQSRAYDLLVQKNPTEVEQRIICERLNCDEEELQYSDLVEQAALDVLQENMSYLLCGLQHGEKTTFAECVRVGSVTVSRWSNRSQRPQRKHFQDICSYFGLPENTDLHRDRLFLSLSPIGTTERRRWLIQRIAKLPDDDLNQAFPFMERLLRTYNENN